MKSRTRWVEIKACGVVVPLPPCPASCQKRAALCGATLAMPARLHDRYPNPSLTTRHFIQHRCNSAMSPLPRSRSTLRTDAQVLDVPLSQRLSAYVPTVIRCVGSGCGRPFQRARGGREENATPKPVGNRLAPPRLSPVLYNVTSN